MSASAPAGLSAGLSAVAPPAALGGVAGVAGVAPEPAALEDAELGGVAGVAGVALEAALEELDSFFSTPTDAEPEAAPGELGVVLVPAEEDAPPGGVVRETARSPSLSQPVSNPVPSARDTATAKVESLIMWASMVGVG